MESTLGMFAKSRKNFDSWLMQTSSRRVEILTSFAFPSDNAIKNEASCCADVTGDAWNANPWIIPNDLMELTSKGHIQLSGHQRSKWSRSWRIVRSLIIMMKWAPSWDSFNILSSRTLVFCDALSVETSKRKSNKNFAVRPRALLEEAKISSGNMSVLRKAHKTAM